MSSTNEGVIFAEPCISNSDNKCSVEGCNSRANRDFHVRFHRIPKPNTSFIYIKNLFGNLEKIDLQKVWLMATNIKTVKTNTRVCSLHFKKEDYFFPDVCAQKRHLRKQAFPSLHLPTTSEEAAIDIEEKELNKEKETITREAVSTTPSIATRERLTVDDFLTNLLSGATTPEFKEKDSSTTKFKDFTVQVTNDDLIINFLDFIKTDNDLRTVTGLESFQILDTITEMVKAASNNKFEKDTVKMNTRTRVVMTYMKLKHNLSYNFLCVIFNSYSSIHCRRVFEETVNILSECLRVAIVWPSKEKISKTFPQSFQGFENVRIILDCIEIFITDYSSLQGFQTVKIMTGVSPLGNITYVSKVYNEKVSVTDIFKESDLLQLLQPGDTIVVDKEFLIDTVCKQNQWKCIRPPLLKGRKQFTEEESTFATKIAAARVPIKQAKQRIKKFKVFETMTPCLLVPLLENIFIIICGTINMNASINNDENS